MIRLGTVALVALALPATATAATLQVKTANDSVPGSLRAAIDGSNPGDTITFAPSLDGQTIALTGGELMVSHSLTIVGPGVKQPDRQWQQPKPDL